jgi:3-methyl-2-oxobutanoate hydroxymethyltransferase
VTSKSTRLTTLRLRQMKERGQKISMLTAYDFTMAKLLDDAGVDVLLVGDSLGMVVQGHETTIPVTVAQMIYHGQMVARAAQRAMVVVDLPFPHGQLGVQATLRVAAKIVKKTIGALVGAGIAVIAHIGLRPQSVHALGGYRVQRDGPRLLADAKAAEAAGAFCVLMECVPRTLAAQVTSELSVPTIGIGAGPDCDGQVLVTNDMLGLNVQKVPKFVRQYQDLAGRISEAVSQFNQAVRHGSFPDHNESFD